MTRRSMLVPAVAYFAANPEEALTVPDAAVKFDACRSVMYRTLNALVRQGYVSRHKATARAVYSAGPELLKLIGADRVVVELMR